MSLASRSAALSRTFSMGNPSRRRVAIALAVALAAQAGLLGLYARRARRMRSGGEGFAMTRLDGGESAPDVTIERADGTREPVRSLRGRFVLVHFWASWCAPCRRELAGALEAGRTLAGEGDVSVVAVATRDHLEAVRRLFGGSVPAEVRFDPSGRAARAFGVSALPDSYLLSPEGRLLVRIRGARDWTRREAREALRAVVAGRR